MCCGEDVRRAVMITEDRNDRRRLVASPYTGPTVLVDHAIEGRKKVSGMFVKIRSSMQSL